jgi:ABC-type nitrate/sulfonate/bicarbonate transport system permease component
VIRRRLIGLVVVGIALAAWELWARSADSYLLPPATTVLERAWEIWPSRDFLADVGASLRRLAAAYAIAAVVGIGVGVLIGASRRSRRALEPLTEFLRAVPPIVVVPLAIVVLGFGDGMRISVIAFGLCFPVLVNAADGVRAISPEARDTAAMLHLGSLQRLYRLYLPGALPSIVAGLRVALSIGLALMVISEFVGTQDGLGRFIVFEQSQLAVPEVYAGILFLGLLGFVLNQLFLVAERYALAWHYGAVGELGR